MLTLDHLNLNYLKISLWINKVKCLKLWNFSGWKWQKAETSRGGANGAVEDHWGEPATRGETGCQALGEEPQLPARSPGPDHLQLQAAGTGAAPGWGRVPAGDAGRAGIPGPAEGLSG